MWDVFTILDIPICQEDSKASRASQRQDERRISRAAVDSPARLC